MFCWGRGSEKLVKTSLSSWGFRFARLRQGVRANSCGSSNNALLTWHLSVVATKSTRSAVLSIIQSVDRFLAHPILVWHSALLGLQSLFLCNLLVVLADSDDKIPGRFVVVAYYSWCCQILASFPMALIAVRH